MAGNFFTFGGVRAVSGSITIPWTGCWAADVEFADTTTLPTGAAALVLGNLSLVGTVYRSAAYAGRITARIVGGAGGWRKSVAPHSYSLESGVTIGMVLGDVAALVGETVNVPTNSVLGVYYVREATVAEQVLRQLAGADWYVDPVGVTQIQARAPATVTSNFLVNTYDPARGQFEISTEDYASWLPGAQFSNANVPTVQTASMVRIESSNSGKLRHTVLATGPDDQTDRMLQPIRDVIRHELPALGYLGVFGYVVSETSGTTITATPASGALPLPALIRIPMKSGSAGMQGKPPNGSTIAVAFLDGNPTQPVVIGGMPFPGQGRRVVCYGDDVQFAGAPSPMTAATPYVVSPGPLVSVELAAIPVAAAAGRVTPELP